MRRLLVIGLGVLLAAGLAGCGNATDNLDFKVPPGYQSKLNLFGTEMWTRGESKNPEVLFLMKLPVKTNPADFEKKMRQGMASSSMPSNVKNAKIAEQQQIRICGNHPAFFIKARGDGTVNGQQKDENIDMLFTAWNDTTYLSMYVYPKTGTPDAGSENALKSVCLKKS